MDYKQTLNLPQTSFSMRANSGQREPQLQEFWKNTNVYQKNLSFRTGSKYILHDGPPYLSSGKIHIGHALNRILKDLVVKYQTLNNHPAPMVFGYDCHGLPIEHEVTKNKKSAEEDPLTTRQACQAFALENLEGQRNNFYRLGLLGDWEKPYLTMNPRYEAAQLRVFAEMVDKGFIYKGLKPVYWSIAARTALAEAEVEYMDHTSHSIYVKMSLLESEKSKLPANLQNSAVSFVIWTTTPWTLPANLGIALNPDFEYSFVRVSSGEVLVMAEKLREDVLKTLDLQSEEILWQTEGKNLENMLCQHPFYERTSLVILGNHVTSEAGTGCVHTAPGHGMEDFIAGEKYKLGVLSPVNEKGIFTEQAPGFEGLYYEKANPVIIELLKEKQKLLFHTTFVHSFPHCWRTKTPLIYRATEQWFASVDGFRQEALEAVRGVTWVPASGQERISNMIAERSDWCISRQRSWGVPIPAFYHLESGEAILEKELILHVADLVETEGSDIWWKKEAHELLPSGYRYKDFAQQEFRKETDIMDVWFDSGSSHTSVLKVEPELQYPADLYLEGSDQHRGWFQSSLLTAIAAHGTPPYRTVLTHGFVLDGQGRKMSKSLGNTVEPQKVIEQYGADVLRLWVASVDYSSDVRVSYDILGQLAEIYKKIRNTMRFMLSNLYDFSPEKALPYAELSELDRHLLHKLQNVITQVRSSFENYAFYRFYQIMQNFCVIDLSNIYFAIVKDILYIEHPDSKLRLSVQTVLWEVLKALMGMVTPVLTHLAEDARENLPEALKQAWPESVLLADYPQANTHWSAPELAEKWEKILSARDQLNLVLEEARKAKKIGRSMEAKATLYLPAEETELLDYLQTHHELLRQVMMVSYLNFQTSATERIPEIAVIEGSKCERCWGVFESQDIGQTTEHPSLCNRCVKIVENWPSV
ncbi:isoleucine--tRNA ligase [bacterium (Candidatus Blackallbacteria) CG17_big_fil_post_rev_8_21_14_2_50_48_46]|uniref:Isoleucine--tRNA ligase n=1 Tax=bacterium (Candidatus Blackallbacteria) CG17_big_fil_post_rev_8_21_14_2_50_48_46 TaxID=2014261 RepID=A0A2M7GAX8_9BACT|nr:MAG: isoleucine--tRNA ligase [bacterium (Candidatus Blackallbacteria) CG18_big_fil_WC_8_21_14_2_50_49_26]PIW19339.1 MAG: isoleucine--tRNA ligase [bacterium (Candidatus Blackallbacteria) CG17_big_fil_post_rev_8_21_14_2_50_48_46]PIW49057.1 MAG: isoleucine--tRNA ligase [bacterium (Candidatus Blackallbacteria) CG13_big_fil_rev_8_21_14_2_50_49_14]